MRNGWAPCSSTSSPLRCGSRRLRRRSSAKACTRSSRSGPGLSCRGGSSGSTATPRPSPSRRPRGSKSSRRRSPLPDAFASLEGKTALVTGGSRGIGRAIALELARADASVTLSYNSGREEAEQVAAEAGATAVQADVASADDARRLVRDAGDLDILVNNAGVTRDGLLARMPDDDWNDVINTNLGGVFHTCRAVARGMMKRRSGSIVNISSIVGLHGNPGQTNYSASKAGIIGFTKALARELGNRGVRANVVAPRYVDTPPAQVIAGEMKQLMLANTPLGRFGTPEDIAGAVRFLCSDEAAFITGEVLLVDGGLGM